MYFRRVARGLAVLSEQSLSMEFTRDLKGMGFRELKQMAKSFNPGECVQREELNRVLTPTRTPTFLGSTPSATHALWAW